MAFGGIEMMLSYRALTASGRSLFGSSARTLHTKLSVNQTGLLRTNGLKEIIKVGKGSTSQQVRNQAQTEMQAFWQKNIQSKRPWSPHLGVYSPPAVMQFSFLHRATGIAMAIVWMGVGCGAFLFTGQYDAMLDYVRNLQLGSLAITGCKFVLCYPLVYHYMNGMRHLAWDYAIGFPIKTCNMTGFTVLGLSLLISAVLASIRI